MFLQLLTTIFPGYLKILKTLIGTLKIILLHLYYKLFKNTNFIKANFDILYRKVNRRIFEMIVVWIIANYIRKNWLYLIVVMSPTVLI